MIALTRGYSDHSRFVFDGGLDVAKCMSNYGLTASKLTGKGYLGPLQLGPTIARKDLSSRRTVFEVRSGKR